MLHEGVKVKFWALSKPLRAFLYARIDLLVGNLGPVPSLDIRHGNSASPAVCLANIAASCGEKGDSDLSKTAARGIYMCSKEVGTAEDYCSRLF